MNVKFNMRMLMVHFFWKIIVTLQLIMVDELKNDYRNPVDFCQNLNRVRHKVLKLANTCGQIG